MATSKGEIVMPGLLEWSGWYARGLVMGFADMVPGISGGTMALITGIYRRLIAAVASVDGRFLLHVLRGHWPTAWRRVDGTFLSTLLFGILSAVMLMSHIVLWLFANVPVLTWGFFLGLLMIAVCFMAVQVQWTRRAFVIALFGAVLALVTVFAGSMTIEPTLGWMFLGGSLAITAMIMPGISGALILLMLGLYTPAVEAVRSLDWLVLLVFAGGCLTGVVLFSRLLHWVLLNFENLALAGMTGIVAGAMLRLWPWQVSSEQTTRLQLAWPDGMMDAALGILAMMAGMALYALLYFRQRQLVRRARRQEAG